MRPIRVPIWASIILIIIFFICGLWQVALLNIGLLVFSIICISMGLDPKASLFVVCLIIVGIMALCGAF